MWTRGSRGRQTQIEREAKHYPSDLTDEERSRTSPLLPGVTRRGREWRIDLREVLDAIR